jgi:hypothetical protein
LPFDSFAGLITSPRNSRRTSWIGRYRIAGDVPSASITQIDLLDLPDNREILRICQHICREMVKRCSPKSRAASAAVKSSATDRVKDKVVAVGNGLWDLAERQSNHPIVDGMTLAAPNLPKG